MSLTGSMYRALVGVGIACGALIVTVYEVTKPVIEANRIEARDRAVLQVLPGAASSRVFRYDGEGFAPAESDGGALVFAGFDDGGALVGVAVEAWAMGYQDVVKVLYGYAPAQQAIVGLVVLESRETPGLGDRVETDPAYVDNFRRLAVALDDTRLALAHEIEVVKPGQKTEPWQIDTISGATITSDAIARMVRDSAAVWVPRIANRVTEFTQEVR